MIAHLVWFVNSFTKNNSKNIYALDIVYLYHEKI